MHWHKAENRMPLQTRWDLISYHGVILQQSLLCITSILLKGKKDEKWIIHQLFFQTFKVIPLFRIASSRSYKNQLYRSKQGNQTAEEKLLCQKSDGTWWPALGQCETKHLLPGFTILFIQPWTYFAEISGNFAVNMLFWRSGITVANETSSTHQ